MFCLPNKILLLYSCSTWCGSSTPAYSSRTSTSRRYAVTFDQSGPRGQCVWNCMPCEGRHVTIANRPVDGIRGLTFRSCPSPASCAAGSCPFASPFLRPPWSREWKKRQQNSDEVDAFPSKQQAKTTVTLTLECAAQMSRTAVHRVGATHTCLKVLLALLPVLRA